ncbi:MAG: daunorubicin/doxorubicin transport system ATP-binding protein [Acidobacteriota bacterium]|jgi:ABC-2 type transport system ATP-binding protein|nr:daunorubicin/doxorubicin transport system ATP-binding protein [Acidobacteriota bacterium]
MTAPAQTTFESREQRREGVRGGEDVREAALRVSGLVKRYRDGTEANRGIDMHVGVGEVVSILGPNGAGKTTFLRQVTTELRPTSGSITVFGEDAIAAPLRAKRLMGITPQEAGVFESLTVREHLELFARLKGLMKIEARRAACETAEELELGAELSKRVGTLSGGQRRRVLVGLALLGRPPLLVLDEPTTGLDPASRRAVWDVIRRAAARGATVILSTHYIEEAARLSDRIGIILAGRLVAFGSLEELLERLERSYRVSYRDPVDALGETRARYFASFAEARLHVETERLSEYSIARASLEDVYFTLTGQRPEEKEFEEAACAV